ncbi:MAG: preprotein translocase subunit SecE [bacterium]
MVDEKEIAENEEAAVVAEVPEQTDAASSSQDADVKAEHSLSKFAREVKVEMKRTNWPTKNELTKMTFVIMATIAAVALYLFLTDLAAQEVMKVLLQTTPK